MWVIASIPFWILGTLFFVGAFAAIEWSKPTTNKEVKAILTGLAMAGILFWIAAKVAS